MTTLLFGIAGGVVLAKLVPMPFLDEPIKKGWLWVLDQFKTKV